MVLGVAGPRRDEQALIQALKGGDEKAFRQLVAEQQNAMLAFARTFLRDPAAAEEAVQETWLALISGLAKFEQRASLKSWIFAVLANIARTKARRNGRSVSFTDMGYNDPGGDRERFAGDGVWSSPPGRWSTMEPGMRPLSLAAPSVMTGLMRRGLFTKRRAAPPITVDHA